MAEWNTAFHGISVSCTDRLVKIKNDKALLEFLEDPETRGALLVSEYVHDLYRKELGKELKISVDSLAIEILGHVYADRFAGVIKKLGVKKISDAMDVIQSHTDIIDCGEKEIDSNRFVWDDLESLGLKKIIYRLCGNGA